MDWGAISEPNQESTQEIDFVSESTHTRASCPKYSIPLTMTAEISTLKMI